MKSFKKIKKVHLVFIGLILFFSCENHVQEELGIIDDPIGGLIDDSICDVNISYELDVEPIIANNCLECHAGSQPPNLSAFRGVSDNAESIRFQVVNRFMPQGGSLTNAEIDFIRCWVDNGAINN